MRTFAFAVLLVSSVWRCAAAPSDAAGVLHKLTVEQAIRISLTNHPHLAEAMANVEASRARAQNADRLPNPEGVARMESAPLSSGTTSQAEYVAGVSQTIPIGGRLAAARKVEEAELRVRQKEYEAAALELARRSRSAFATALYTAEVLNAQTNLASSVAELVRITRARVSQGDATPADLARVETEEAEQKVATMEAAAVHHEALDALATSMGDFRTRIESLDGNLEESLRIADLGEVAADVGAHPAIGAMENAVAAQRARVRLATTERVPDVNLDLFYRRLQGPRENAFDVGVRVPIPIFDNGRRRVREAESDLRATEARLQKARNEIGHELHARELELERALRSATLLKEEVLPKVEMSLRTIQARYAAGDVSLSELLLIRRQAAENRIKYLSAVRDVMHAWAALKFQ